MTEATQDRPMSPKEIAEHSGHHVKTVLTALRRGELIGYQRAAGCSWRAYPEDVNRWIRGERATAARRSA